MQVNDWIYFLVAFAVLMIAELLYFKIADRYNIIDKPNQRSSHSRIVLRGGGIVFSLAALAYELLHNIPHPYFLAGLAVIAVISFLDDIKPVRASYRFVCQLISVVLLLFELQFQQFPLVFWLIAVILLIGIMNAWNFMDGINGITSGISLVTVVALYVINKELSLYDVRLFVWTIAGLLVFTFFNARQKAKCFAGDIGSICIAYIILFMIVNIIVTTGNPLYLLLLSVYGIDSVFTIFTRIKKRENIFLPHRQHLYQYLANELKWPHLTVSGLYAAIQLVINLFMFYLLKWKNNTDALIAAAAAVGVLIVTYIIIKRQVVSSISAIK